MTHNEIPKVCANCEYWKQFLPYGIEPYLEGICKRLKPKKSLFGKVRYARTKYNNYCRRDYKQRK